ncbi:hypothetical protein [Actinoplanes sp. URMC 104]|uniref:hypothetical protein n=1 Tax=Actinoplanes sp. URMC 104 TaxID=3423409 RepID=UPI003F1C1F1C
MSRRRIRMRRRRPKPALIGSPGAAYAHGGTPPWCEPTDSTWAEMADDRLASNVLGIPLADDDDLFPAPVALPPVIPLPVRTAVPARRAA